MSTERSRNEEAYPRFRGSLEQEYCGQFVVIAQGKLVAASPILEEAVAQAESAAPRAAHRLIVKVGEDYPSVVTIGASPSHG